MAEKDFKSRQDSLASEKKLQTRLHAQKKEKQTGRDHLAQKNSVIDNKGIWSPHSQKKIAML